MKSPVNQRAKYKALNLRLAKYVAIIQNIYEQLNKQVAMSVYASGYTGEEPFKFAKHPLVNAALKGILKDFRESISATIYSGTSKEWQNSNEIQDLLANKVLKMYGATVNDEKYKVYYQPNNDALKAFQQRKDNGMSLSQKIWNQSLNYKTEMEYAISSAVEKGTSAVTLSKRLSKYLNDFHSLKKDYKEKFGTAVDCHDCEYRSIRLARSEINMAYRTAEQKRWEQMDFVVGYEIKLSTSHHDRMPHGDICDTLAGKYPKDFHWTGWHPNDMCYCIPILKTEDEFFDLDNDSSENEVTDYPESFKLWISDNSEKIRASQKTGTLPYWLKDNTNYKDYLQEHDRYSRMALTNVSVLKGKETSYEERTFLRKEIRSLAKDLNLFNGSFNIHFTDSKDGTIMKWENKQLTISTSRYKLENGEIFCPEDKLFNALNKLKRGVELDFYEEYTIENLYHENIHSKGKGLVNIIKGSMDETICEGCTQLYARHNYVSIMNLYNVKAVNFDKIQNEGIAYNNECRKLRPFFRKDSELLLNELLEIAYENKLGTYILKEKLIKNGFSEDEAIEAIVNLLK